MVIPEHAVVTGVFGTSNCSARTVALIPDWLSFSTSSTLHPAGGAACCGWFLWCPALNGCRNADHAVDVLGELRQLCYPRSMVQPGTRYPQRNSAK